MSRVSGDGACSLFPVPCSSEEVRMVVWKDLERLGLSFGTNLTEVLKGLFGSEQLKSAAFLKLGDSTGWSSL